MPAASSAADVTCFCASRMALPASETRCLRVSRPALSMDMLAQSGDAATRSSLPFLQPDKRRRDWGSGSCAGTAQAAAQLWRWSERREAARGGGWQGVGADAEGRQRLTPRTTHSEEQPDTPRAQRTQGGVRSPLKSDSALHLSGDPLIFLKVKKTPLFSYQRPLAFYSLPTPPARTPAIPSAYPRISWRQLQLV